MSIQLGRLVSNILLEHFGDVVEKVGADLFRFGSKDAALVSAATRLPRPLTKKALCALVKYGLVDFAPASKGDRCDYSILERNVLQLLRYPKYILHIKNKYGAVAEAIIEELLQEGSLGSHRLLANALAKIKDASVVLAKDTLVSLVTARYVESVPPNEEPQNEPGPIGPVTPEVDLKRLAAAKEDPAGASFKDDQYWRVNFDRFHQDFRDELLISAMTRSIDECGGELMRILLQILYQNNDPWTPASKPIPFVDIKDFCKRTSDKILLFQYLDQYLSVVEESSDGVVMCSDSASGGQYVLKLAKASELLVWDLLYSTVQERLGTKAARIFRLIKTKKYIEEEDIQKNAMLPAKEAKQLTYKLMEEHFIEVQSLRKTASSSAGPSKAFYLYYIDLNNVANMLLETIYKALYNVISRREYERDLNKRMIDKQQRVDTMVHSMRLSGAPEENIQDVEETVTPPEKLALERIMLMIKKLSCAEMNLCESMFILEMYFLYKNKK